MPRHYLRRPTTKQYNTMQHSAIDSNKNEIHVTHYLRRPMHCLHVPSVAVCNKPQHTATHCITLQRTATHCSILQHTATHFKHTSAHCKEFDKALIGSDFLQMSVLSKWVVVFFSVLQCAAVCCSVLQCVAVCYSVLQCIAVCCIVLPYVAVCCSVLQCVTVCYSVLQCTVVSPRLVGWSLFQKTPPNEGLLQHIASHFAHCSSAKRPVKSYHIHRSRTRTQKRRIEQKK